MNVLKTGLAWLTNRLADQAADAVRYERGGSSVIVPATYGEKMLRIDDGAGGVRMEWSDLDFCIPVAQLVLGGTPSGTDDDGVPTGFVGGERIAPRRGDRIFVEGAYGETRVYEVMPLDSMGDSTHRLIHLGAMWRVHTKFVEVEGC